MRKIPYGKQHITDDDILSVIEVLKSEFLTQGPKVAEFETEFAKYIGCRYAIAVANGTAALHLCTLALDVRNGDNVITTPITFSASANCVKYVNGEVIFSDIDPETYLLDIKKVEQLLKTSPRGKYKGIILVDFAGKAVNLEEFRNLADKYGLWIIEDACHAPGGYFFDSAGNQSFCGNGKYADLAIFSFHPVKHITCGEGGMITTNNKSLYEKIRNLRTHGIQQIPEKRTYSSDPWYYEMQELGFNYRLTDFQAALGTSQLKRADSGLMRRRQIAQKYCDAFSGNSKFLRIPQLIEGHAYHLFVLELDNRKGIYEYLRSRNIFPQVHYIPVHLMPYYRQFGWKEGDLPNAEKYYSNCLSIPIYPSLSDDEQQYVIDSILSFLEL